MTAEELSTYQKAVLQSAEDNHIWMNAFRCIRPSDEFAQQVGHMVLSMLGKDPNLIDSELGTGKVLILRINKS